MPAFSSSSAIRPGSRPFLLLSSRSFFTCLLLPVLGKASPQKKVIWLSDAVYRVRAAAMSSAAYADAGSKGLSPADSEFAGSGLNGLRPADSGIEGSGPADSRLECLSPADSGFSDSGPAGTPEPSVPTAPTGTPTDADGSGIVSSKQTGDRRLFSPAACRRAKIPFLPIPSSCASQHR